MEICFLSPYVCHFDYHYYYNCTTTYTIYHYYSSLFLIIIGFKCHLCSKQYGIPMNIKQ